MFTKILVPVDGSEGSWHALECAIAMADKFAGELIICNVVQTFNDVSLLTIPLERVAIPQDEALEEIGNKVLELAKEKLEASGIKAEYILEVGHPSQRIVALSEDKKCDAIVIGSRGLSGIAEFFLGSVSSKVSQYASVPVVIVK
ncbi:MAG: universal stress protein [Phascolarctobacterium sp.]|nr:universal stress protein [Phascolarctobacterium sp.]